MPGLLLEELETEIERAAIGLVPQRPDVDEFNLPSKLMNLMSRGVPVLASVNPSSEIARIVRESGAGWVVDAADPEGFPRALREHPRRPRGARAARRRPDWSSPVATSARTSSRPGSRTALRAHAGDRRSRGSRAVSLAVITGSTGLIGSEAASYFGGPRHGRRRNRQRHAQGVLRLRGVDCLESSRGWRRRSASAIATTRVDIRDRDGSRRRSSLATARRSSSSSTRPRSRHTTGRPSSRSPTSTSTRSAR